MHSNDELIEAEAAAIAAMVESARNDRGAVECSACGRERSKGEYTVSLLGHGAMCSNVSECLIEFERQVKAGNRRLILCQNCFRTQPMTSMSFDGRLRLCADSESCAEARAWLDELRVVQGNRI